MYSIEANAKYQIPYWRSAAAAGCVCLRTVLSSLHQRHQKADQLLDHIHYASSITAIGKLPVIREARSPLIGRSVALLQIN